MTDVEKKTATANDRILEVLQPLVAPLGYDVIYVEIQTHRQKTLRVFIDFLDARSAIGIEDCVRVTRALDEPLENHPVIDEIFGGAYELEVSSPGVDRPLRDEKDYVRYTGNDVRLHVFRPLTAQELGNEGYQAKNPKQKNFLGKLVGLQDGKIVLDVSDRSAESGKPGKKKKKVVKDSPKNSVEAESATAQVVSIPLPLISKANLEPRFDFGDQESE